MRQYLLPREFQGEDRLSLNARESHYLVDVLRFPIGERFSGLDRSGTQWDLVLIDERTLSCARAEGKPLQNSDTMPSFRGPFPRIRLYQCLCKGKKDELIVRAATEIGVERITFVQSRFCTADLSRKQDRAMQTRNDRLEAIIKEAIQQSGSPIPTQLVERILTPEEVIQEKEGLFLFFHQCELSSLRLDECLAGHDLKEPISLLIGSEGGFSDDECTSFLKAGFLPVLLRTNILRAETAALYALAAVQSSLTRTI